MKRQRWAATTVPTLRRALTSASHAESARTSELAARATSYGLTREANELARVTADHEKLAERLPLADLFWVTASMSEIAMDAASDVPGIRLEDCPAANGLIVFAKALPPLSTEAVGGLALLDDTLL